MKALAAFTRDGPVISSKSSTLLSSSTQGNGASASKMRGIVPWIVLTLHKCAHVHHWVFVYTALAQTSFWSLPLMTAPQENWRDQKGIRILLIAILYAVYPSPRNSTDANDVPVVQFPPREAILVTCVHTGDVSLR